MSEAKAVDAPPRRRRIVGVDVGTARMGVAVLDVEVRALADAPRVEAPRKRHRCAFYTWGCEPHSEVVRCEVVHAFASRVERLRAGDPLWPRLHVPFEPPAPAPRRTTPERSAAGGALGAAMVAWVDHHAPALVSTGPDVVVVEHQTSKSMRRAENLLVGALRARLPRSTRIVRVHPALKTMGLPDLPPPDAPPAGGRRRRKFGPSPERHAALKRCAFAAAMGVVSGGGAGNAWSEWLRALPQRRGKWDVSDAIMHAYNYAAYC